MLVLAANWRRSLATCNALSLADIPGPPAHTLRPPSARQAELPPSQLSVPSSPRTKALPRLSGCANDEPIDSLDCSKPDNLIVQPHRQRQSHPASSPPGLQTIYECTKALRVLLLYRSTRREVDALLLSAAAAIHPL